MHDLFPKGSRAGLVSARPVHVSTVTDHRRADEPFSLIWFGMWHSMALKFFQHCWHAREHRRQHGLADEVEDNWLEYG